MTKMLVAVALLVGLASTPAGASNTRTWISGKGTDASGCGPVANPCRTLQYAHDNTTAGGEIDVLDPAGYGPVIINKSIAIVNDGVGVAGVLASPSADAIRIIMASSDKVALRGLTIEGAGVGSNGIDVLSGGTLTVDNCVIQGFVGGSNSAGNGILIAPDSGTVNVALTDTKITNNDYIGLSYIPGLFGNGGNVTARISVDRTTVTYNKLGIATYVGFIAAGNTRVPISNSYVANNQTDGVQLSGGAVSYGAMLDNDTITGNSIGIYIDGSAGGVVLSNVRSLLNASYDIYDGSAGKVAIESFRNNAYQSAHLPTTSVTQPLQ